MAEITGHCLCGGVRVTVAEPAGWLGVCHCRPCQRWSGTVWAGFPAPESAVTIEGPVQRYASSPIAERAFCATCGSHLWMRDVKEGADYDLMPGLFDEASDWPLKSEAYSDQACKAFALKGDHRKATAEVYRQKYPEVSEVEQ